MKTNSEQIENNINQLLVKLKNEDSNYARISKAVTIMYWILIPLFILITIIEYIGLQDVRVLISGVCFVTSFLIFAIFFRKYYNEYKYVDYSLPTLMMLKKAAWRYQPFQVRTIWILVAIILMDIGLTFNWGLDGMRILDTQIFFGGAVTLGIIIGLIVWYFKYKPIRDEALKMINEIES